MKTIGLIGGMSWESSLLYYKIVNERIRELKGGLNSSELIMYSFNFENIEILQHKNEWDKLTEIMTSTAKKLENAGADFIIICTNTMHIMAEAMEKELNIPILHISDATAEEIKRNGIKKVGLLGTKFTMEKDFYKGRLINRHGIDVIIPDEDDRNIVHDIIYNELCMGKVKDSSREKYIEIINKMIQNGAEGIILGCTEICMLISEKDVDIPVFDTTRIHGRYAADFAVK